jgi:hypothetical protein
VGTYLAVAAGLLIILGLMRMAQSVGVVENDRPTKQGAALMCLGLLIGFLALLVLAG